MHQEVADVVVIDDDEMMRAAMKRVLQSSGYVTRCHASTNEYLEQVDADPTGCIVIDVRMPGVDGLASQRLLVEAGVDLPVILVSGFADVALSVRAMQQGAFTFLTKPFREQDLLDAVAAATRREADTREERSELRRFRAATEALSPREREILANAASGALNKTIAARLGVSEITVKVGRARIMRKLGATSIAHLARMVERLRR